MNFAGYRGKPGQQHPQMASIDPGLRSHFVETLDVALLRLRVQHRCGLGLNQKLPFVDAHKIS
jgi:hypothetical protein